MRLVWGVLFVIAAAAAIVQITQRFSAASRTNCGEAGRSQLVAGSASVGP